MSLRANVNQVFELSKVYEINSGRERALAYKWTNTAYTWKIMVNGRYHGPKSLKISPKPPKTGIFMDDCALSAGGMHKKKSRVV